MIRSGPVVAPPAGSGLHLLPSLFPRRQDDELPSPGPAVLGRSALEIDGHFRSRQTRFGFEIFQSLAAPFRSKMSGSRVPVSAPASGRFSTLQPALSASTADGKLRTSSRLAEKGHQAPSKPAPVLSLFRRLQRIFRARRRYQPRRGSVFARSKPTWRSRHARRLRGRFLRGTFRSMRGSLWIAALRSR